METTCSRCHQTIASDGLYCPSCGLPQLVYAGEEAAGTGQAERWTNAVRDAGDVDWRTALRGAAMLAVPAGLLSCGLSPVGVLGLFWMAAAAAWAVTLYVRRQKAAQQPSWVSVGAGARIGLVTGIIAGWMAFAATGVSLFVMRYGMHQGKSLDDMWQAMVTASVNQQLSMANADAGAITTVKNLLLSPEGRAGSMFGGMALLEAGLLLFAVAGGAIGAKMVGKVATRD
jgi:hypothetical protein